ncbi:MAG: hypothetical protein ABIJ75_07155 [Actinomycetota bacterium]
MHGDLSTRLQEEFGPVGPLVWVALLAAAKRSPVQGRFTYTTVREAWDLLGFIEPVDNFDLEGLWRRLGQLKKTRRTRHGRVTNITVTRWKEWNDPESTRLRDQRNPRSGGRNTGETPANSCVEDGSDSDSESESDIDSDSKADLLLNRAMEEVTWRATARGETIKNPKALARVIADCYRGHPNGSGVCPSPVHGLEALNWHRARREDEDQARRAEAARNRGGTVD